MKRSMLALVVAIMICGSLFAEKIMPNFTLPDVNGKDVKLSEALKKGPVIVDFWASWCQPCLKELPKLDELQKKYPQITVLAITIDAPKSTARAKAEVKSKKYEFTALFDSNSEVKKKLGVNTIPQTFIVQQDGTIVFEHNGYNVGDEVHLEEALHKLLTPVEPETGK